jgi:hypothetical protein
MEGYRTRVCQAFQERRAMVAEVLASQWRWNTLWSAHPEGMG